MKNYIIILGLTATLASFGSSNRSACCNKQYPPDTTVLSQILSINLSNYIGKPVDSLFNVLPRGYTNRGFMVAKAGYARGVYQSYSTSPSNNCFVEIFIDTFQYLPIPNLNPTTSWNMNLAKQETVAYIKVWKNNRVCMYGCSNPAYDY